MRIFGDTSNCMTATKHIKLFQNVVCQELIDSNDLQFLELSVIMCHMADSSGKYVLHTCRRLFTLLTVVDTPVLLFTLVDTCLQLLTLVDPCRHLLTATTTL